MGDQQKGSGGDSPSSQDGQLVKDGDGLATTEDNGQSSPELLTQLVEAMGRHPKVTFGAGVVGGLLLGQWWRNRPKPEGTPDS